MRSRMIFRAVRPYISVFAVLVTASLLVMAIYYNELDLPWVAFLTGILAAALLAMASRASRTQWLIARRTAKLSQVQDKLVAESRQRRDLEARLAVSELQLHLINDVLPVMALFIDHDGMVRFHNRSFRNWLGLGPERIDGRSLREVLGTKTYDQLAVELARALSGEAVVFEQPYTMLNGTICRFRVQYLPHLDADGRVDGVYALQTELSDEMNAPAGAKAIASAVATDKPAAADLVGSEQSMFVDSYSEQVIGWDDAVGRIMTAIEQNEFRLYCQKIASLADGAGNSDHYEIFIRLIEEEEGMMPPGAFFPLVEKYGLMPRLDRWVVEHVVELAAKLNPAGSRAFFINLAPATVGDPDFPSFVRDRLAQHGVAASALCFELTDSELSQNHACAVEFVRQIRSHGCAVALSGFGRDGVTFEPLRGLKVDFLKIDGSIILDILRDPMDLARVVAITRVARTIGISTVAEFVESDECIAKLKELGADYAQGFGIATPHPLIELA